MKAAVLFPGQGSQKVGMGFDLHEKHDFTKDIFKSLDSIAGRDISKIIFKGPDSELNQTKNTQPAIVTISAVLCELLKQEFKKREIKFSPLACCGHSLGEFTAIWFLELLSTEDLLKIVSKRGDLMQRAPEGAMAAILNLDLEKINYFLKTENVNNKITIANYNSPTQYVISGDKQVVNEIIPKIKSLGGKAILLPVSGAFHSYLMETSSKEFNSEIDKLHFLSKNTPISIFQNVDGKPSKSTSEIKEKLKKQMTSPVQWIETINNLTSVGIDSVIEIGPGKVLTGLVKKINPNINCFNVFDYDSLIDFANIYQNSLSYH